MKVRPSGSTTRRCLKFCRPQKLSSKTSPLPQTYLSGSIGSSSGTAVGRDAVVPDLSGAASSPSAGCGMGIDTPPAPEGNGPGDLRDADAAPCRRASDAADRPCNVLADYLGREGVIGIDLAAAVGPLQIHPSEAIREVDPDARNLTHRVENGARIGIPPASLEAVVGKLDAHRVRADERLQRGGGTEHVLDGQGALELYGDARRGRPE